MNMHVNRHINVHVNRQIKSLYLPSALPIEQADQKGSLGNARLNRIFDLPIAQPSVQHGY